MKIRSIGANQTEVDIGDGQMRVLVSYNTPVAVNGHSLGNFRTEQKWSATTAKHISQWGAKNWPTMPQSWFDTLIERNPIEHDMEKS